MKLTETEQKELEVLENSSVQYLTSATGGIFSALLNRPTNRRDRIVSLRMKLRSEEIEEAERAEDWPRMAEIREEEEKRADDICKNGNSKE